LSWHHNFDAHHKFCSYACQQQVTIPIEIQMNGIPHLQHIRSASLAGLSVVNLIFDDNSDNDWDRQKALGRLSQVTLPGGTGGIRPDFSPIGSVYWYTIKSFRGFNGAEISAGMGDQQIHRTILPSAG
jgi:Cu/Ag efflux pump CusA